MAIGDITTVFGQSLQNAGQQLVNQSVQTVTSAAQNAVNSGIEAGLSLLPNSLRGIAKSVLGGGGATGISMGGGSSMSKAEDFNKLRQLNKKLVHTDFVQDWNFKLKLGGQPADFDLFVKDVTISGFEISTDEERYGGATFVWPTGDNPATLSFTAREHYDLRISQFLWEWGGKATTEGGTVGLPVGAGVSYARKCILYNITTQGEEKPFLQMFGYPVHVGDITRSHENGNFMELPVTIQQFSTLYNR